MDDKSRCPDAIQREYWSKQSRRRHPSDPIIAGFARPKVQFLLQFIEVAGPTLILDVGCGNGYFTYYLERVGRTVAFDYSQEMLQLNPCANLVQGSALSLPFPDSTFDLVFCSNLLHHLSDPHMAAREMQRVSRRYVAISEPNRNNLMMLALALAKREERNSLRFTGRYLRSIAEEAGLRTVACESMGFVTPNRMPRPIATLLSRLTAPHPLAAYCVLLTEKGAP